MKNKIMKNKILILCAPFVVFLPALNLTAALLTVTPRENVDALKAAIIIANSNGEPDVIELGGTAFDPAIYTLTDIDNADNGLPVIANDGPGNSVTITHGTIQRVSGSDFRLLNVAPGAELILDTVTLQNGLLLAGAGGGAVYNAGTLSVIASSFISNSTNRGGAIASDGVIDYIKNSTFSGNSSPNGIGGALYNGGNLGVLSNSTFTLNSASGVGLGGAIFFDNPGIVSNFISNIVAKNTAGANQDIHNDSVITNASYNLIGVDDPADPGFHTILNGVNNNQVGSPAAPIDPQLGPLSDNGGPTLTHAILPTSPAINTGNNPPLPPPLIYDQRGFDFKRSVGQTDIGAFECQCANCAFNCEIIAPVTTAAELIAAICAANSNGVDDVIDCGGREIIIAGNNTCPGEPAPLVQSNLPAFRADGGHSIRLQNCIILPNGRGIFVDESADATLNHVTIRGARLTSPSEPDGAAVYNSGSLSVEASSFEANIALGSGGAIEHAPAAESLDVSESSFIDNESGAADIPINAPGFAVGILSLGVDGGAAIAIRAPAQQIKNNTFTRNRSNTQRRSLLKTTAKSCCSDTHGVGFGAALYNNDTIQTLSNNTFTNNFGGGILNDGLIVNLVSVITACNSAADNPDIEDNGRILNASFNLIGIDDPQGPGFHSIINGQNGNQVGSPKHPIDPRLGPLKDNGGPTLSQALLFDSTAIDAGANPQNLLNDQRGPGFLRTVNNQTDIGAFECQTNECRGPRKKKEDKRKHKHGHRHGHGGGSGAFGPRVGGLPPMFIPVPTLPAPPIPITPILPVPVVDEGVDTPVDQNQKSGSISSTPAVDQSASGCSTNSGAEPFMCLMVMGLAILMRTRLLKRVLKL